MASPPEGEMQPGADEEQMAPDISEEDQDLFLKVAGNATKLLYQESTTDLIVDALKAEQPAVEQLAKVVSTIVEKVVVDAHKQESIDVPLDMVARV